MFQTSEALASLAYLAITYPIISIFFCYGISNNKKTSFRSSILIVILALIAKLAWEYSSSEANYYSILSVSRRSSAIEIRQSYKKISLKLHPDKNPGPDAEEKFQKVKSAYDVLMDETKRDIYNRFGPNSLNFDPRTDELNLLLGLAINYLLWGVAMYIATLPPGARGCRTWIIIVLIAMLVAEVFFCLTETTLPNWMPPHLTEHEFAYLLHSIFPGILVILRCFSEYLYVDVDKCTALVLTELCKNHKGMHGLLHQLQILVTPDERANEPLPLSEINEKIAELRNVMRESNEKASESINILKGASANPGSNYYWLIFVAIYAGVYFFQ